VPVREPFRGNRRDFVSEFVAARRLIPKPHHSEDRSAALARRRLLERRLKPIRLSRRALHGPRRA
jgi:hypothetical protein